MRWDFISKVALVVATTLLAYGAATNSAYALSCPGPSPTGVFDADLGFCGGGTQQDWGIPGVDQGTTPYLGSVPAYGFEVTFSGGIGTIDSSSILLGNETACAGSSGGGTTFCTISESVDDIWVAFQTGPRSIDFLAQDPSFYLSPNQSFFVNVFFNGDPYMANYVFIDTFSPNLAAAPLPSTWLMLLSGFIGLGYYAYRGTKNRSTALATV